MNKFPQNKISSFPRNTVLVALLLTAIGRHSSADIVITDSSTGPSTWSELRVDGRIYQDIAFGEDANAFGTFSSTISSPSNNSTASGRTLLQASSQFGTIAQALTFGGEFEQHASTTSEVESVKADSLVNVTFEIDRDFDFKVEATYSGPESGLFPAYGIFLWDYDTSETAFSSFSESFDWSVPSPIYTATGTIAGGNEYVLGYQFNNGALTSSAIRNFNAEGSFQLNLTPTPVPEPSSMLLLSVLAIAAGCWKRFCVGLRSMVLASQRPGLP